MCASGVLLDFANRLPRGRTYARRGSIWHLQIHPGRIDAKVHGSRARPYQVTIQVSRLPDATWKATRNACSGQIGSLLELLRGSLSDQVMALVTDPAHGLFPQPRKLDCRCPDWANRCKHVAAVLYGAGNRLDRSPELLFRLRQVDPAELVTAEMALPRGRRTQTSWPTINSAAFSASSSMRIRTPAPPRPDPVRVQPAGGAYSLPSHSPQQSP